MIELFFSFSHSVLNVHYYYCFLLPLLKHKRESLKHTGKTQTATCTCYIPLVSTDSENNMKKYIMLNIKNGISFFRYLGGRQSYTGRQRERLDSSFETKQAAVKRKETSSEPEPTVKRKRHAGNFDAMTWDKNALKLELEGYADETKVNWSELARRYQITNKKGQIAKNGGQIAQEWLISQGVNLHRFKRSAEDEQQPRRKKLKGLGGKISIPTPETNDNLKKKLKLKIQQGEFTVGELIVPREVSM